MLMKDHAAILIMDNEKILFIKRSNCKKTLPNIWAFPSGTKEANESIEQTVSREAYEELGIKVKVEKTLAVRDLPEFNVRLHFITCNIVEGTARIREPLEISQLVWLSFKEFFEKFNDSEIGHGLIFLRQNKYVWENL